MATHAGSGNITTGATSAIVIGNRNGKRVSFSITNYGSNLVWVNLSNTQIAAAGVGIPVYPGTTIADGNSEGYMCWQGTITCVDSAAGSSTLAYWERVAD